VLENPLGGKIDAVRADRKLNVPVVLTRDEVGKVIPLLEGTPQLIVKLLYGSGLRILEAVRLRVKDLDFQMRHPRAAARRTRSFPARWMICTRETGDSINPG